ncbi:MAG: hypothetical protein PVS2B2_03090 [Candidatus Acidiferrum sp.]
MQGAGEEPRARIGSAEACAGCVTKRNASVKLQMAPAHAPSFWCERKALECTSQYTRAKKKV